MTLSRSVESPTHLPLGRRGVFLNLITVVLWAGNPVATSFSTDALPPFAVAGIRFALATAFMLVWCLADRVPLSLRRDQFSTVFIAGLLLFLQIWTFTVGVAWTTSSHASLAINTYVFWVVVADFALLRRHSPGWAKLSGLVVAAAGVALLVAGRDSTTPAEIAGEPTLAGDLMLLFSAWIYAVKFIYTKLAMAKIGPGQLMLWHDVVAVLMFAVACIGTEQIPWHAMTGTVWLSLVYQGILVGGVCFALQAYLLRIHSATEIAVYSFATPLIGVLFGVWLRNESLSSAVLVAGVLIAVGIFLVNYSPRRRVDPLVVDSTQVVD